MWPEYSSFWSGIILIHRDYFLTVVFGAGLPVVELPVEEVPLSWVPFLLIPEEVAGTAVVVIVDVAVFVVVEVEVAGWEVEVVAGAV